VRASPSNFSPLTLLQFPSLSPLTQLQFPPLSPLTLLQFPSLSPLTQLPFLPYGVGSAYDNTRSYSARCRSAICERV
jgi:hypothetical protein